MEVVIAMKIIFFSFFISFVVPVSCFCVELQNYNALKTSSSCLDSYKLVLNPMIFNLHEDENTATNGLTHQVFNTDGSVIANKTCARTAAGVLISVLDKSYNSSGALVSINTRQVKDIDVLFSMNWDFLRSIYVENLSKTWEAAHVILQPSRTYLSDAKMVPAPSGTLFPAFTWNDPSTETCSCDPEMIRWTDGLYYLYYSGVNDEPRSVTYLARAASMEGEFEKYSLGGNWIRNSNTAKPISNIYPGVNPAPLNNYGAGQVNAVVKGSILHLWVNDYSGDVTSQKGIVTKYTSTTPTLSVYSTKNVTNITTGLASQSEFINGDGIIRYDAVRDSFYYFWAEATYGQFQQDTLTCLKTISSKDGVTWRNKRYLFRAPIRSMEFGVGSNEYGHLVGGGSADFVWSAPRDALTRNLPDPADPSYIWSRWMPTAMYHASVTWPTTTGTPVGYASCSAAPIKGKKVSDLPELSYYRQYGYAASVVKHGTGWNVTFCSTPILDGSYHNIARKIH